DDGRLAAAIGLLNALQNHVAVCLVAMIRIIVIEDRLLPKVKSIYISVPEIKRPLVRFKRRGFRVAFGSVISNRKIACHNPAGGSAQRHQVGLRYLGIKIVRGEWFSIDADIDLMR